MESEGRKSKHLVKHHFQVTLEDEEEDSLFMDSWIYLDLDAYEELLYAKEYQSADEDVRDITKKVEDGSKLSQTESFQMVSSHNLSDTLHCIPSTEDSQLEHYFSPTVSHFKNSDGLKDMNFPRTFSEYKSDILKVCSSEPPPKALCSRIDISEQSMDVYSSEGENTSKTSDNSSVAKSPDTISISFSSMAVDNTIDSDETITYSSDMYSSGGENTVETLDNGSISKSPDTISRSFSSMVVDNTIDSDETNAHSSDMYCSKVESELPDICASKSFLHDVTNPCETWKYSTDTCSGKLENTIETPLTHVSKSSSSEMIKLNKDLFIKTESNCHSERKILPIFYKNEKKSFSDMPIVVISDDEAALTISDDEAAITISDGEAAITLSDGEAAITISDGEAVVIISDDEHSDTSDIIYVGSHQSLSAYAGSKDDKPSLDKTIKAEPQIREQTTYAIATNYDSDSNSVTWKENTAPQLANPRQREAVKRPTTSGSYISDVILAKKLYTFPNPKVINLAPSKPENHQRKNRRKHKSPRISVPDIK